MLAGSLLSWQIGVPDLPMTGSVPVIPWPKRFHIPEGDKEEGPAPKRFQSSRWTRLNFSGSSEVCLRHAIEGHGAGMLNFLAFQPHWCWLLSQSGSPVSAVYVRTNTRTHHPWYCARIFVSGQMVVSLGVRFLVIALWVLVCTLVARLGRSLITVGVVSLTSVNMKVIGFCVLWPVQSVERAAYWGVIFAHQALSLVT